MIGVNVSKERTLAIFIVKGTQKICTIELGNSKIKSTTGHGFTKDVNRNIIPEYTMDYIKPKKGAELYRVNSETGIEELIAKYIDGKFVKIK